MSARAIESVAEMDEIKGRLCRNEASEEDKWRHYATTYKAAWGISCVDEAFVDEHGTQAGSAQVRLLTRVLCPSMRKALSDDVTFDERKAIFRVVLVEETITALGVKSPFDVDTVIPDLMAAFNERLIKTPMFREYDKHAAMFRMGKAGIQGEWNLRKVSKAVNMVLGAAGLSLKGEVVRVGTGKARTMSTESYRLNAAEVDDMMELVSLRLRRCRQTACNDHAKQRMDEHGLPKYGDLLAGTQEECKLLREYAFIDDCE